MDMYQSNLTSLQEGILRFLFTQHPRRFNGRAIASRLSVSQTAIHNSLPTLEKEGLIIVEKDKESKRLSIGLNKDNPRTFHLKRVENLRNIYESGLARTLAERFPGATIILFGSYSFGEDTTESDVDITVIGYNPKRIDLQDIETILERKIHLNFFKTIGDIEKNLKENILNGMILSGGITL